MAGTWKNDNFFFATLLLHMALPQMTSSSFSGSSGGSELPTLYEQPTGTTTGRHEVQCRLQIVSSKQVLRGRPDGLIHGSSQLR